MKTICLFFVAILHATPTVAQEFVYLSNVTGTVANGQPLTTIEGQTTRALDHLGEALREHGLDYSDVVVSNVFLTDSRHFGAMNAIYRRYFPTDPPTRATVQADLPDANAMIQFSVVATSAPKQVITPEGLMSPALPYSWGMKVGNTLFVSGATARDPESYQPIGGDISAQTRRVWGNIGMVLEAAGMDFGDLVSCKVFLDDARQFGAMNAAYGEFVPADDPPARATMRARLMNPAFDTEIQCVAEATGQRRVVIGEGQRRSRSPFSPAISTGDRLYTAGMVGGGAPDVAAQTRNALESLRGTLAADQMDFSHVKDLWVYVSDIRQWGAVEAVLRETLPEGLDPTVVGMPLMGATLLVEIQMVAQKN